jgi:predicted enzyme related to lactoylglutathione lyase
MATPPGPAGAVASVDLTTSDVDATCCRAAELGGVVIVPVMEVESMRFAVVQDPAAAVFGVMRGLT